MHSQVKEKDTLISPEIVSTSSFFLFNNEAFCYEIWESLQLLTAIW